MAVPQDLQPAAQTWTARLERIHGPMVSGSDLRMLLGFNDADALSRAIQDKRCPVPTFKLPGRWPHFAWCRDVGNWLDGLAAPLPSSES